jgi:hypothetical protein
MKIIAVIKSSECRYNIDVQRKYKVAAGQKIYFQSTQDHQNKQ